MKINKEENVNTKVNILKQTIDNIDYVLNNIVKEPKTMYELAIWHNFKYRCDELILEIEVWEEKYKDIENRIGIELNRLKQQEIFKDKNQDTEF